MLRETSIRTLLGVLLAVGALNALVGGSYGMAGAGGLPTTWLEPSPFGSYFVPGLVLFVVVGGVCLLAAVAVFRRWAAARRLAQLAAIIVLGFIWVEMAIIGSPFWLQPVTAVAAALIFGLSRLLPVRPGPPSRG